MLVKTYSQKLTERIESVNSNLCVGLDPRVDQIDGDFEAFVLNLIDETISSAGNAVSSRALLGRLPAAMATCGYEPRQIGHGHPSAFCAGNCLPRPNESSPETGFSAPWSQPRVCLDAASALARSSGATRSCLSSPIPWFAHRGPTETWGPLRQPC